MIDDASKSKPETGPKRQVPGRSPMSRTTKGVIFALFLSLAWVLFLATSGKMIGVGVLKPPPITTSPVTATADFRWVLRDLDGNPVKLSDYAGRPIVLNIWGTYCPPCLDEMPSLDKLSQNARIQAKGVVILCVSYETVVELKTFMKDQNWKMTILQADPMTVPPAFQTEFIPATFVIDPEGKIVFTQAGPAQWDDPSVVDFLEKMAVIKP